MGMKSKMPYLKTCVYTQLWPPATRTMSATSWKDTGTGTYNGATDARTGLSSGTLGAPQTGGWILGAKSDAYRQALLRRGRNCDPTSALSCWQTKQWSGAAPDATNSTKYNAAGELRPGVILYGEGLVDYLAMHDLVIIGPDSHPPASLVDDIKKRSRRPGGTRVIIGQVTLDAINQHTFATSGTPDVPPEGNSLLDDSQAWRAYLKGKLLTSSVQATWNGPSVYVDQYEANGFVGSTSAANPPPDFGTNYGHTWVTKFMSAINAGQVIQLGDAIAIPFASRYPSGTIDGILFGDVTATRNFGIATNANPTTEITDSFWTDAGFRNSWRNILRYMGEGTKISGNLLQWGTEAQAYHPNGFGKIFANVGGISTDATYYSATDVNHRFIPHLFHVSATSSDAAPNTLTSIYSTLAFARRTKMTIIGGVQRRANASVVAGSSGLWTDVVSGDPASAWDTKGGEGPSDTCNWAKVLTIAQATDMIDHFYVCGERSATGGIMFWHPTFGPLS